jgi:formate hydrogenlyase subunit 4
MFVATGSFNVADIWATPIPVVLIIPGIFLGFVYILTIKLRKSPFDISTSHHAHQEIVKGVTTEYSGPSLGLIEITHWYETVLLLGLLWLFFGWNPLLAVVAIIVLYLLEVLIDNTNARVRWQFAVKSAWLVAFIAGIINLAALYFLSGGAP